VFTTTVNLVPLRTDLEPARRDDGLGAKVRLAVLVVHEPEAVPPLDADRLGVTAHGGRS
jgi:hypothetical protein